MKQKEITTKTNILVGLTDENGVSSFKGVPYAQTPVGDLRWKEPKPLNHSGVKLEVFNYGASAIQEIDEIEDASTHEQSEDCLTLNIWTRYEKGDNKPVMVFIHGGSYMSGGTADPLYDGYNFALNQDVVFVTLNYRLNLLGFLDLSLFGKTGYENSGRLGLLDQICALTWVKENIEQFGGDEDNITIFGESCGAGSVSLLMTMPRAKGLFNKVIAQSGAYTLKKSTCIAKQITRDFLEFYNIKTFEELKNLSSSFIQNMATASEDIFGHKYSIMYAPSTDGTVLPEYPLDELRKGSAKDIKFMTGTNAHEFNYWKFYFDNVDQEMPRFLADQLFITGDFLHFEEEVRKDFFKHMKGKRDEIYIAYADEILFRLPALKMAESQAIYNDAFVYYFNWESKIPGLKSCHALELPFVFDNLDGEAGLFMTGDNPPRALAEKMQISWASFAANGHPNNSMIPNWEKYDKEKRMTMIIGDEWKLVSDHEGEARQIIERLFID